MGKTVHSWLKSAGLKPNADKATCFLSVSESSVAGTLRSKFVTFVKLPVVVTTPFKIKLLPVTRIDFLTLFKLTEAPMRSLVLVELGIVARVVVPVVSAAVPAPTTTLTLPVWVNVAVHLPVHF